MEEQDPVLCVDAHPAGPEAGVVSAQMVVCLIMVQSAPNAGTVLGSGEGAL